VTVHAEEAADVNLGTVSGLAVSALIRVAPPSSLTHVAVYFVIHEPPSDAGGRT